jgi:UDP-N-acetylglucosamine 4,6-dehydratase/5-epimerase
VLQPDLATWGYLPPMDGITVPDGFHYASDTNDQWYSIDEIRKILESE